MGRLRLLVLVSLTYWLWVVADRGVRVALVVAEPVVI
jgi:hypothetical protein